MRLCLWCGQDISDMRADAKYCRASHRVMASRARKLAEQKVDPPRPDGAQIGRNEALTGVN
jgi:hypothetical protein